MKLFETIITETTRTRIRVKANSAEEAQKIFDDFVDDDMDYVTEELDNSGNNEWIAGEFKEVHPSEHDEAATISRNPDGTFNAQYEGYITVGGIK